MKDISSSIHHLGHNHRFSHANSKVDIDDISSILSLSFKSSARDDLLINFLVSLFTPCKNLRSFEFNLGRICVKQISSLFTIKSHKFRYRASCPSSRASYRVLCISNPIAKHIKKEKKSEELKNTHASFFFPHASSQISLTYTCDFNTNNGSNDDNHNNPTSQSRLPRSRDDGSRHGFGAFKRV